MIFKKERLERNTALNEAGAKTYPAVYTSPDNNHKSGNYDLPVAVAEADKHVTGVTLDKTSLTVKENETAKLTATVAPANASANSSQTAFTPAFSPPTPTAAP